MDANGTWHTLHPLYVVVLFAYLLFSIIRLALYTKGYSNKALCTHCVPIKLNYRHPMHAKGDSYMIVLVNDLIKVLSL